MHYLVTALFESIKNDNKPFFDVTLKNIKANFDNKATSPNSDEFIRSVDLFDTDDNGKTLLHIAAAADESYYLEKLLVFPILKKIIDKQDIESKHSPLHAALINRKIENMLLLLQHGAAVHLVESSSKLHFLTMAIDLGFDEATVLLLKFGAGMCYAFKADILSQLQNYNLTSIAVLGATIDGCPISEAYSYYGLLVTSKQILNHFRSPNNITPVSRKKPSQSQLEAEEQQKREADYFNTLPFPTDQHKTAKVVKTKKDASQLARGKEIVDDDQQVIDLDSIVISKHDISNRCKELLALSSDNLWAKQLFISLVPSLFSLTALKLKTLGIKHDEDSLANIGNVFEVIGILNSRCREIDTVIEKLSQSPYKFQDEILRKDKIFLLTLGLILFIAAAAFTIAGIYFSKSMDISNKLAREGDYDCSTSEDPKECQKLVNESAKDFGIGLAPLFFGVTILCIALVYSIRMIGYDYIPKYSSKKDWLRNQKNEAVRNLVSLLSKEYKSTLNKNLPRIIKTLIDKGTDLTIKDFKKLLEQLKLHYQSTIQAIKDGPKQTSNYAELMSIQYQKHPIWKKATNSDEASSQASEVGADEGTYLLAEKNANRV